MVESPENIIHQFYQAFARHDAEAMAALYHVDVVFTDPAFGTLRGDEVRSMWRMLIERGNDSLVVTYAVVKASGDAGSAQWTADYRFGSTGRMVHNEITARFEFSDGKIIRHIDSFNFWTWSRQALGSPGLLLGWTPFLKNKVLEQARKGLRKYMEKRN